MYNDIRLRNIYICNRYNILKIFRNIHLKFWVMTDKGLSGWWPIMLSVCIYFFKGIPRWRPTKQYLGLRELSCLESRKPGGVHPVLGNWRNLVIMRSHWYTSNSYSRQRNRTHNSKYLQYYDIFTDQNS